MATPRQAYAFNQSTFGTALYTHKLCMYVSKEKYVIELSPAKLFPLRLAYANILFMTYLCTDVIKQFIAESSGPPLALDLFNPQLAGIFVLILSLDFCVEVDGVHLLEEGFNALLLFDRKLWRENRKLGYAQAMPHWTLLIREMQKLFRGERGLDVMGLFMHGITLLEFISGLEMVIYMVIEKSIPISAMSFDYSSEMLKSTWRNRFGDVWGSKQRQGTFMREANFNIWRRELAARNPIKFYYGLAIYDSDTKPNFYYSIFENTIIPNISHNT